MIEHKADLKGDRQTSLHRLPACRHEPKPVRTASLLAGANKDAAAVFYHRLHLGLAEKQSKDAVEPTGEVKPVRSFWFTTNNGANK